MQKKVLLFFWVILSFASKAQNPSFVTTIDSINAIIKANPLFYYMPEKQYDAFVKKINVTYDGVISFKDSIVPAAKSTNPKSELIADCCAQKDSRTLDILNINKWDIHFPNAYLKNENGENIGQFTGLKQADMQNMKEQFYILQSLCFNYVKKRDEAKAKAIADHYRCDLPDPKKRAAAEAAMKKADELSKNKK
ncbi:hypothetical protein [Flavobacterium hungaricum]|uniref:Uncharacterized protein n=1 Tax=Flavobacterium hungaricum TaxID=2082725 RepID=A0ABR9TM40_9FLAO|nr:hypothetical protein [Flavobacterium hungaricum]MBE8726413.1 hypothetical protein [Flavobacterium hungaricum]